MSLQQICGGPATQPASQAELADLAGIDRSYVSDLERSVSAATIDMIENMAAALQVAPKDFLVLSAHR
jgi:transcriptional regulator with XRE-family HTH domain